MCNITCNRTIVYVCLHLLEPEISRGRGSLHIHCTKSTPFRTKLLILQANLNLEGLLQPYELYTFKIRENDIVLSRKCNLEWILTRAIPKSKPAQCIFFNTDRVTGP